MLSQLALASAFLASASLAAAGDLTTITAGPQPTAVEKAKRAEGSALPLTQYTYSYSDVPYQVNPYASGRGPQTGFNICNSTTVSPTSECQTLVSNNISDFCLWGSPTASANGTIGDVEAAVVAYCTTDQHGTRVIPPGAITGVQILRTSAYIQWTGHINQTALNLMQNDTGGELDPHGADLAGNPLGGLVYSTGLPSGDNKTEIQAIEWNNFVGSGEFCLKLCDPTVTSPNYCENKFDLLGCAYNMPAAYQDGVFLDCDSDLQDVVGTYTSGGQTYTWSQPSSLPATSTLPWTPVVPSSSNCKTYQSSDLFPATLLGYQSTVLASATASASGSGASSGSRTTGSAGAANTGGANGSSSNAKTSGSFQSVAVSISVALAALVGGGLAALA